MRIGVSLSSSIGSVGADPSEVGTWILERAQVANQGRLDSLSVGDHHALANPYYQNTPLLGRLLAEWGPRPVGCLFLLPLWDPLLVAEHVGTLASLVTGPDTPFIVQTGLGSGPDQFAAMGVDHATRGAEVERRIALIKRLLAGDTVSSAELHPDRPDLSDGPSYPVQLGLRPNRPIEWWVGGGAPVAIDRAARLGDAWYAGPGLTADNAAEPLATYRRACEREGATPRAIVRRDAVISAEPGVALRRRDEILAEGYRGMTADDVLAGTVAEVVDQLAPLAEAGFDDVIVRCMRVSQAEAIETISLLPAVRALL